MKKQFLPGKLRFRLLVSPALAGMLVSLLLLIAAMAASPALHEWLHHDAGAPDHECAVTLFAKGHVDALTIVPVLTGLIALIVGAALLAETLALPSADYRFSASRAPPFSSFCR